MSSEAKRKRRSFQVLLVCGLIVVSFTILATLIPENAPEFLRDAAHKFLLPGFLLNTFLSGNPHLGFHDWRNYVAGGMGTWLFWMLPAFGTFFYWNRKSPRLD